MTDQPGQPELWADWITIWQSEMAALAADREVQEALQRAADLWALQAMSARSLRRSAPDDPARRASPDAPARTPSPPDAPGGRDAVLEGLLARIAELERRLG